MIFKNNNRIFLAYTFILVYSSISFAQECGPSCPVCSGNSDGALLAKNSILATALYIPLSDDEKGVIGLRYGVFTRLDIGVGYAIQARKPIWSIRLQPLKEGENWWKPGIILGTGSVQTGRSDQSVYCQISKSWEIGENFALRTNIGAAMLVPQYEGVFGLAGITTSIYEKFSIFANFDGRNFHEGISWIPFDWITITALLVESRTPALSTGFKWVFSKVEQEKETSSE